jgi:Ni/Fe-hydrogenase 1 B-type cytochrome subunit
VTEKMTRHEHPLPAVLLHWVHLLSFFTLMATGLYIHSPGRGFPTIAAADEVHFVTMYVFVLTTVVRVYWAYFGAGSATLGSVKRIPDHRHFALTALDSRTFGSTLAYYLFLRKTRPYSPKYNPLQKVTYGYVFPLLIAFMALTGFSMFLPTMGSMTWFAAWFGGQNGVRLAHYLAMWVLFALVLIHFYLVVFEDVKELPNMLLRYVPESHRVAGDYPAGEVPGSGRSAPAKSGAGSR